jgi:hypothetical protein
MSPLSAPALDACSGSSPLSSEHLQRSHIETGDALIEGIHAADDEIIEKEARLAELDREIEAAEARLADSRLTGTWRQV